MTNILLTHTGAPPFVQQVARALYEHNLLAAYVTTFDYRADTWLGHLLRAGLRPLFRDPERELRRRMISEVPHTAVVNYPLPELLRMAAVKLPFSPIVEDRVWDFSERWFSRIVARRHGQHTPAVYSYQYCAYELFQAVRRRGGICIYEQPIAHYRTVAAAIEPEYRRFPQSESAYDRHLRANAARRNQRMDAELAMADLIICASSFTKQSLIAQGIAAERIAVVPYGSPEVRAERSKPNDGRTIFLCAGTLSVRKGVHHLLEAWRRLKPAGQVELHLIGRMQLPAQLLENLPGTVRISPSLPQHELFERYQNASLLLFPSLAEGFGQVISEAMAHGLPVLTTAHTAGPDLISHGEDGLIVPVGDIDRLAEQMAWCIEHPDALAAMGRAARRSAMRRTWSDYRNDLAAVVAARLGQRAIGIAE